MNPEEEAVQDEVQQEEVVSEPEAVADDPTETSDPGDPAVADDPTETSDPADPVVADEPTEVDPEAGE